MTEQSWPKCAGCGLKPAEKACRTEGKKSPSFCPMELEEAVIERARQSYQKPANLEFARQASLQEASCYLVDEANPDLRQPVKPRLQEIAELSQRMGYRRLGLAFCIGLRSEAAAVSRVLEAYGFEVVSVICKVGRIPKEEIGVADSEKISPGKLEVMCNPVAQAELLNAASTDFNIALGLCVGHDSLFFKYAQAPTTVLAAKDRVTGHNPLAAVYTLDSYYTKLLPKK
ncbi:MAG TPA: DUF1847 domain-containing protein [Firmicutes bacterium]|nr:DUF1847 domain-containing protein [Bacillota bacterium]